MVKITVRRPVIIVSGMLCFGLENYLHLRCRALLQRCTACCPERHGASLQRSSLQRRTFQLDISSVRVGMPCTNSARMCQLSHRVVTTSRLSRTYSSQTVALRTLHEVAVDLTLGTARFFPKAAELLKRLA